MYLTDVLLQTQDMDTAKSIWTWTRQSLFFILLCPCPDRVGSVHVLFVPVISHQADRRTTKLKSILLWSYNSILDSPIYLSYVLCKKLLVSSVKTKARIEKIANHFFNGISWHLFTLITTNTFQHISSNKSKKMSRNAIEKVVRNLPYILLL